MVWIKAQSDDLFERLSADKTVRSWINLFIGKNPDEIWDTAKWANFAKKVEKSHHQLVDDLELV